MRLLAACLILLVLLPGSLGAAAIGALGCECCGDRADGTAAALQAAADCGCGCVHAPPRSPRPTDRPERSLDGSPAVPSWAWVPAGGSGPPEGHAPAALPCHRIEPRPPEAAAAQRSCVLLC